MQNLQFSIDIRAPKEKIWNILWDNATFRDWANNIDPGMYLAGTLEEGAEVQFCSASAEYAVRSLVEKFVPTEIASFRHLADTMNGGTEEREHEWTGGVESYALTEHDGVTTLSISSGTPPEQVENFNAIWPKVLGRIKELAEAGE
ncbi:MAG TPA: hypothetical protein VGE62_03395 [Candidatus Paceibacterota bacterium]